MHVRAGCTYQGVPGGMYGRHIPTRVYWEACTGGIYLSPKGGWELSAQRPLRILREAGSSLRRGLFWS